MSDDLWLSLPRVAAKPKKAEPEPPRQEPMRAQIKGPRRNPTTDQKSTRRQLKRRKTALIAARGFPCELTGPKAVEIYHRMKAGTATAADILYCAMQQTGGTVGTQWGLEGSEYGADWADQGAADYAYVDESTSVRVFGADMLDPANENTPADIAYVGLGELAVILIGNTDATYANEDWDAAIEPGSTIELTEIRYDAGWGWKKLPAYGLRAVASTPAKLYHGTNVELSPGDTLRPARSVDHERHNDPTYYDPFSIYLTDQDHLAERYALGKVIRFGGEPHVYEVRPIGLCYPDPEGVETGFGTDQWCATLGEVVREIPLPNLMHIEDGQMMRGPAKMAKVATIEVKIGDWMLDTVLEAAAWEDGKVVGAVEVAKPYYRIEKVYVRPSHRRRGIATMLARALEAHLGRELAPGDELSPSGAAWSSALTGKEYYSTWGTEGRWDNWLDRIEEEAGVKTGAISPQLYDLDMNMLNTSSAYFLTLANPETLSGWKVHIYCEDTGDVRAAWSRLKVVVDADDLGAKLATARFFEFAKGTGQWGKGVTIYFPRRATWEDDLDWIVRNMEGWPERLCKSIAGDTYVDNGVNWRFDLREDPGYDIDPSRAHELYQHAKMATRFEPGQMAEWESTKPWNLTSTEAEAQLVPGWWGKSARGTESASWEKGYIRPSPDFFSLPESARRAIAYHEAGHAMIEAAGGLASIPGAMELVDLPGGKALGYNGEEILAEAYSVLWTEPEWFERNGASDIRTAAIEAARRARYPLPGSARTAISFDRDDFLCENATLDDGTAVHFVPYGDAVPGGYNGGWLATVNGIEVGHLDYQSGGGEVGIGMVEVSPEWRRRGVASALLGRLRREFPGKEIDPGMTTPEGSAWWAKAGARTATLKADIELLRPQLAHAVQQIIDEWAQDSEGFDEEFGYGGACDQAADAMASVLADHGIETAPGGAEGDDHAWVVALRGEEVVGVDIPPGVYETGGGYSWTKRQDVSISPGDVDVWDLDVPAENFREGALAKTLDEAIEELADTILDPKNRWQSGEPFTWGPRVEREDPDWASVLRGVKKMYRGYGLRVTEDEYEMLFGENLWSNADKAAHVLEMVSRRGLGMHWTKHRGEAAGFAGMVADRDDVRVIVEALPPRPEDVLVGEAARGFGIKGWDDTYGEQEIPIRPGAPIQVVYVEWGHGGPRPIARADDGGGWTGWSVNATKTAVKEAMRPPVPFVDWKPASNGMGGSGRVSSERGPIVAYRGFGSWDEAKDSLARGEWISSGMFTVPGEGDTQMALDLNQVLSQTKVHPMRGTGFLGFFEADISGLPFETFKVPELNPVDDTRGNFEPDIGLGIGIKGGIPLDRIRRVVAINEDGSWNEMTVQGLRNSIDKLKNREGWEPEVKTRPETHKVVVIWAKGDKLYHRANYNQDGAECGAELGYSTETALVRQGELMAGGKVNNLWFAGEVTFPARSKPCPRCFDWAMARAAMAVPGADDE